MSSSLQHLFTRIRQSDRKALEELYFEMAEPLVRYAYGLTGSKSEAMDVVHDVFVKVWDRRTSITITKTGRSFLYSMTRNHFLNRKKRAARSVATDFSEPNSVWQSVGSEPQSSDTGLAERIRKWIDELPPRRSEAFMLSRFHGLSHLEIARIMDLSERTVDTNIQHALRDLRTRLKQHEVAL